MPGLPGYFRLPGIDSILNHALSLFTYRASRYLGRLPTQNAESGSLTLCANSLLWLPSDPTVGQWRPCHLNYLPCEQGGVCFLI
jgi:hypothetical protein